MMDIQKEIGLRLRSRHTLICIVSHEEERVLEQVKALCARTGRQFFLWDHADNFQALGESGAALPTARDPISALEAIDKIDGEAVFLLRDFHQCWHQQPRVIRKLRNLSQTLKYSRKSIVVTMPVAALPDELKDDAVVLDVPPPDFQDLVGIMGDLTKTPGVTVALSKEASDRVVRSALGLSSGQAQRVFAKAIVSDGVLDERDLQIINNEKRQIIRNSGALEFYTPSETVNDVGGLEALKEWVLMRESAFSPAATEYGLPAPKGIALIGIPGTGKSLSAKAVASLWRMPLIRLDLGALFGSLVGQSEENARRALQLAETVAPCVLWIDEIEKGLATGGGDGGTSSRVFGTILSWMQEKTRPVFVIATANNIALLPPELLRRGRFDEIFFLDLPSATERRAIFRVHIAKRKRDPAHYDLEVLVAASQGYVGAEIEQAVIDAMYVAFNDCHEPRREFTTHDILLAIGKLVPMSRSQREVIESLRAWLTEGRAQSASRTETRGSEPAFVPIQPDADGERITGST